MNSWYNNDYRDNSNAGSISDIDYDRMEKLEKYTDFEFSTTDKTTSIVKGVGKEAKKTLDKIDEIGTNIGAGLLSSSKLIRYLPFLVIAYFAFKLLLTKGVLKNVR